MKQNDVSRRLYTNKFETVEFLKEEAMGTKQMNSEAFSQVDITRGSEATALEEPKLLDQDFRIGEWIVKPQLNQLRHIEDGGNRHLEPRLAKLLCYLASFAGDVVDRDTLVAVLWPRVIVNENSLTRAVSELRKQLKAGSADKTVYIETIPKRGYRLSVPVEASTATEADRFENSNDYTFISAVPFLDQARHSVPAALCLSLVLGAWLQFQTPTTQDSSTSTPAPWSDELVLTESDTQLRDEIMLSSSELANLESEKISDPVLSTDEEQFAYIQYDHTGSTLYLGQVDGEFEPVPVFNSADILYNLGWSPVGNALLFASKPALTPALYDKKLAANATLYSFDLDSFRLSKLVEKSPFQPAQSENELSLT